MEIINEISIKNISKFKKGKNQYIHIPIKDLFNEKVNIDKETNCWNWLGSINNQGYGHFRYNGKIEDRIKTIRGGFGSFDGAKSFMDLQRIMHNFVNPHQQLKGKTPAEMAEINLPLKRNNLLNLIRFLAKTRR